MSTLSLTTKAFFTTMVLGWGSLAWAAGPISSVSVSFFNTSGPFIAGVTTNTVTPGVIWINCTAAGGQIPDAGATVSLALLDSGGAVISGGVSPSSFLTDGVSVNYGGLTALPLTFYVAGSGLTLRATSSGSGVTGTSSAFLVTPGAASHVVVFAPGQSLAAAPTQSERVSGTALIQPLNQAFPITVQLTDAYNNPLSVGNDTVHFAAQDPAYIDLPPDGTLSAGVGNFNVTLLAPRTTRRLTVSNVTHPGVLSGTIDVVSGGPADAEVFPVPNPFNPHRDGQQIFRFVLDSPASISLSIMDPFGQPVWRRDVSGVKGNNEVVWNGRNDHGQTVAVGFYYLVLEADGSVKSKKKLGVVK